jgi:transposase
MAKRRVACAHMRIACKVELTPADQEWLLTQTRSALTPRRLAERCRIVLLAAEGKTNEEIAALCDMTRQKAGRWRDRFVQAGRMGIERDAPGRGRKLTYAADLRQEVVRKTTTAKPLSATHWSRQSMAKEMCVSESTVGRIWRENGLKPHLIRTFKVSNDPLFADKLEDIVGLYLNAPEHAIVLSCDEKSQIQALDRTQPGLPLKKGRAGTMTHDYVRNGTTTLFAALNVATGEVISQCQQRHRHQEWIKFLQQIDQQTPVGLDLHLVLDNYGSSSKSV